MASHSSTPAWKVPWTEEPGRLQSVGSQRVGHDLVTKPPLLVVIFNHQKGDEFKMYFKIPTIYGTPLQYSYLENPMEGGAW